MKTRVAVPALLLVLLALVPAAPAAAFNWGVGVDLGYSVFMPDSDYGDNVENVSCFGWPLGPQSNSGLPAFPGSGLRVSFAGEEPIHEAWLSTSLSYVSSGGVSINLLGLSANYQYNFDTSGAVKPYVTAGAGLLRYGFSPGTGEGTSAMSSTFGGGVGVAGKMGTGRLRGEVRYDLITEGTGENEGTVIRKGGNLGLKLGFDLWNK